MDTVATVTAIVTAATAFIAAIAYMDVIAAAVILVALRVRRAWTLIQAQAMIAAIACAALVAAAVYFVKAHVILLRFGWRPWKRYESAIFLDNLVLMDIDDGTWYRIGSDSISKITPDGKVTEKFWR